MQNQNLVDLKGDETVKRYVEVYQIGKSFILRLWEKSVIDIGEG